MAPRGRGAAEGAREARAEPDFLKAWKRQLAGGVLEVEVNSALEAVAVDPLRGPRVVQPDGSLGFSEEAAAWSTMASADQKLLVYKAARTNQRLRGAAAAHAQERERQQAARREEARRRAEAEARARQLREEDEERERQLLQEQLESEAFLARTPQQRIAHRCETERARAAAAWRPVAREDVQQAHGRRAPGVFYGLDFPWSAEGLLELGPEWLTRAFHAAGTLERRNRVTAASLPERSRVAPGNSAACFALDVDFAEARPDLHRRLFAKVPLPLRGPARSERLRNSVDLQPRDFLEVNSYRLLEDSLPARLPKFYFGDISNETSNFILITERVPFAACEGEDGSGRLEPFKIEGPYEKCRDHALQGPAKEYYLQLMRVHATVAAAHKVGSLGSEKFLRACTCYPPADAAEASAWGAKPDAPTGAAPDVLIDQLRAAVHFLAEVPRGGIFPWYVTADPFQSKLVTTMMTLSAYEAEIAHWKHMDPDYLALSHGNLTIDNAFFWRDQEGTLDCGALDLGGLGVRPLADALWAGLACAGFEELQRHLPEYVQAFVALYAEHGGPTLDEGLLELGVRLAALQDLLRAQEAVPEILRRCPTGHWATIRDREDPRLAMDPDGRSTLRMTLHTLFHSARLLEEGGGDEALERWVQDVYVPQTGGPAKGPDVITGEAGKAGAALLAHRARFSELFQGQGLGPGAARPYDIIIYGATGFTGCLMAEHLDALLAEPGAAACSWAVAGRNAEKLEAMAGRCRTRPAVLQAVGPEEVSAMAAQCRVVVAAAGPYQLFGEVVVKACVEHATHYVDITGETPWVHEMIEKYHDTAKAKGVMIVHCAAQVCSPDDINCYLLAKKLGPLKQFREYFFQYGATTGGTFSTNVASMEGMTPERFAIFNDPFNLGGRRRCQLREDDRDCSAAKQDSLFASLWLQPAYNGHTGSRIIRRSCQLFEEAPGDGPAYGEELCVTIREGVLSKRLAEGGVQNNGPLASPDVAPMVAGMMKSQRERGEVPQPGEGPPAQTRAIFYSDVWAVAEGESGKWAHVHYRGPESYEVTAMASVTAALVLAQETERLRPAERGGVLTPAFAFHGSSFIERLESRAFAGGDGRRMRFEVLDGKPEEDAIKGTIRAKTKDAVMGQGRIMSGELRAWDKPALLCG